MRNLGGNQVGASYKWLETLYKWLETSYKRLETLYNVEVVGDTPILLVREDGVKRFRNQLCKICKQAG